MKKLSIIIPVFNEVSTVRDVLYAVQNVVIPQMESEIIVVDDYSTDGTRDVLEKIKFEIKNLKIFNNEKNHGKGFSVRKGLSEAAGDFVLIQDADLEYNPNEYGNLLTPLERQDAEVVYGSRFLGKPFTFKTYYLANRFLTALSNFFTGFQLTDMETCYKCFSKEALQKILPLLTADRFDIEPEITSVVAKFGLRIVEVPISYERRSYEQGKKIGFHDGLEAVFTILRKR